MKQTLKRAFWNGTLRKIAFGIGCLGAFAFLLTVPMAPILEELYYRATSVWPKDSFFSSIGAASMLITTLSLLAANFLPSPRKRRRPAGAVPKGSDKYVEHMEKSPDENFSNEERQAILQESWMAIAERFNRNRAR